ncbi:MAG TPA: hypothetical protein VM820_03635, partial [Vicinamibacterales bacterium]|nr:hypothetical protein [Vicinamibacterales bacterium]
MRAATPPAARRDGSAVSSTASPAAPTTPVAAGSRTETRERMTKRRATIARRLVEAQRTAAML